MEQQKPDAQESALVVLTQWRGADRAALADKRSRELQRTEFKMRNRLRDAADKLSSGES